MGKLIAFIVAAMVCLAGFGVITGNLAAGAFMIFGGGAVALRLLKS